MIFKNVKTGVKIFNREREKVISRFLKVSFLIFITGIMMYCLDINFIYLYNI